MTIRKPSLFILPVAAIAALVVATSVRSVDAKLVGPPEVAWKDMKLNQKRAYMKGAVMPKMKPIFQAFDAEQFKNFTCETCHGKGAADKKYKMPSPDIHPLPSTPEAFQAKVKEEPTWPKFTEFMAKKVEPSMAGLLAMPVFDPKHPVEGAFGCVGCHTLEPKKP